MCGWTRESIKWRATFEVLKLTEGSAFSQLFLSRSRWPAFEGSDKHWWSGTLCSCRQRSSTCGTDRATTQPLEKLGVGAPGRTRTCDLLLRRQSGRAPSVHSVHLFHSLTSIRGFCFRSKSNPFPMSFLDFWNTFGTAAASSRRLPRAPGDSVALQLSRMALACAGYRVSVTLPGHHQTTFEAAALVLGAAVRQLTDYFETCRRNVIDHDSARRSHAPNRYPRGSQSAAAGSTPPAASWAAPASPHRTAGTAPPRIRRSGIPPAVGSSADRTDDSPPSPAKPEVSTSLLVALDPSVFPSPCAHSTRRRADCIPRPHKNS